MRTWFAFLVCLAAGSPRLEGSEPIAASALIDLLQSVQPDLEDLRCEFEGTVSYKNYETIVSKKLSESGLYDNYSGVFIWKKSGDVLSDVFHRYEPDRKIARESLVVRAAKNETEHHLRQVDEPLGRVAIKDIKTLNATRSGCLGQIFLSDDLKRTSSMKGVDCFLGDGENDGLPVKVVEFKFANGGKLYRRYWFDARRGGMIVRREEYTSDGSLVDRTNIQLAEFRDNGKRFWVPIKGRGEGYATFRDGQAVLTPEPTIIESIYIIDGTLTFNRRPPSAEFALNYKPGTPISDNLRQIRTEFGKQPVNPRPSRSEAEKLLREQLATAEAQRTELIASSAAWDAAGWSSIFFWLCGAGLVGLLALATARRFRRPLP